jgi:hypothetical protein
MFTHCKRAILRGESLEGRRSVPQYFFTIHGRDRVEDDPDGVYLPDVAAALSYAEHTIRELRKESGYKDDLALMMIVTDHNQTALSLPFFPGC